MIKKITEEKEVVIKKKVTSYHCAICRKNFNELSIAEKHHSMHMSFKIAMNHLANGETLCLFVDKDSSDLIESKPNIFVKLDKERLRFLACGVWENVKRQDLMELLLSEGRLCAVLKKGSLLKKAHDKALHIYGAVGENGWLYFNK